MSKNPLVGVIAAIVLIVAVIFIFKGLGVGGGGLGSSKDAYWYDMDTGKLFGHEAVTPPIEAPSGGEGVRAHVFACNNCDDESDRFIGFLERYTDEGKRILKEEQEKGNPMARALALEGVELRREKDEAWLPSMGEEGRALRQEPQTQCGGKQAKQCFVFQD